MMTVIDILFWLLVGSFLTEWAAYAIVKFALDQELEEYDAGQRKQYGEEADCD